MGPSSISNNQPSNDQVQPGTRENSNESGGFRSHLARALSGAATLASGASHATPAAGAVAAGLSGLSRILDSDAERATHGNESLEKLLSESQGSNARYIELQARMQAESQAFTAISNIMRSRHESAQPALNNIR